MSYKPPQEVRNEVDEGTFVTLKTLDVQPSLRLVSALNLLAFLRASEDEDASTKIF